MDFLNYKEIGEGLSRTISNNYRSVKKKPQVNDKLEKMQETKSTFIKLKDIKNYKDHDGTSRYDIHRSKSL